MNRLCDQFLSRTTFAGNQYGGFVFRNFPDQIKDLCHGFTSGHDATKGILVLDLFHFLFKVLVFRFQTFTLFGFFEGQKDFIRFKRFRNIIVRTFLDGLKSCVNSAVSRHHNEGLLGVFPDGLR